MRAYIHRELIRVSWEQEELDEADTDRQSTDGSKADTDTGGSRFQNKTGNTRRNM